MKYKYEFAAKAFTDKPICSKCGCGEQFHSNNANKKSIFIYLANETKLCTNCVEKLESEDADWAIGLYSIQDSTPTVDFDLKGVAMMDSLRILQADYD